MILQVKNWDNYQHYKDRNPPWIKVHKKQLDDPDFMMLSFACVGLAQFLWLLASESKDGIVDASVKHLTFRLRKTEREIKKLLNTLINSGFFIVIEGCTQVLADDTESPSEGEAYKPEGETKAEEEVIQLTQIIDLLKPEFPNVTPAQIGAVKAWVAKGKTLTDIQDALIKTAGSQRSATRWGWIVDEMNKVDRPDKPKKEMLRK